MSILFESWKVTVVGPAPPGQWCSLQTGVVLPIPAPGWARRWLSLQSLSVSLALREPPALGTQCLRLIPWAPLT